ncbi:MAG: multidrug ABC transporter ATP-binding protein [Planctomycetaceae bacterium]|nr:multidrug ABC transporter ATP-binding protein [Planctomycetaceae bacterium]
MIEAIGLSKFYGPFAAARGVTFEVPKGQVCAFLGPNGAGKSTTMKMLTGYLAPTEGEAKIGGFNSHSQRLDASAMVGYLPENGPLYDEMTPKGLIRFMAEARGLRGSAMRDRTNYVAETCSLGSVWSKPISKLSRGFRQRVGMAQALLHDPQVLILDEPTSGLDPNQVHGVREMITNLGKTKTILLSTHILAEVEAVCSRVLLISNGRLVFDGSIDEMKADGKGMEEKFRELTTAEV